MHLMRTFCWCKNAFLQNKMLQMHLMPKCILAYIFQRKMFSCAKMHLMPKCILATHHIFQRKMFSCAKMHLMPKCILATHHIFLWKMFSCAKMHLMPKCILATHHIFQRKMFSITFSKGKCSASNAFLHSIKNKVFITFCLQNVRKPLENLFSFKKLRLLAKMV